MAWIGSQCDQPAAYRAARSAYVGDTNLAMVDADLSSVAVAQAAALANAEDLWVGERFMGVNVARGFQIASNLGGTFSSSFATLAASLPSNANGNKAMQISGS